MEHISCFFCIFLFLNTNTRIVSYMHVKKKKKLMILLQFSFFIFDVPNDFHAELTPFLSISVKKFAVWH